MPRRNLRVVLDNMVAPLGLPSSNAGHVEVGQPLNTIVDTNIPRRRSRESDSIFEDMVDVEYDAFQDALEDLVDTSFLTKEIDEDDDRVCFRTREGLSWSETVTIDCPIKKQILLCLIDNPRTFFVLYNTQKGKLRIASEEIRSWASVPEKKVVGFLLVDNDKTLADQTAEGAFSIIESVADIYLLSSNSGDTLDSIKNRIDSYAAFGGKMPVIVALNNAKQIKKITLLMKHIQGRMLSGECSALRYGVVFDEADKIYPTSRGEFEPFLVNDVRALHRLGFVTATEGDLMDADYPECANAYMYPVPAGNPDYRAIHTEDAVIKHVTHLLKDSNDVYAENILKKDAEYFKQTVTLNNGTQGYRKVIVNGGGKTASMEAFAKKRIAENAYAITVNMMGVNVYRPGHTEKKRYSAKGIRFGQLLFNIYNELGLHDKPLFVIGRRKVDRGLGFHFAPRDGSDGLIFTDMILGRIDIKASAVQKAGRLAGVVAQCPQYCGSLTWWTDERTSQVITRHNEIVDVCNTKRGCSALQAITRGEAAVPEPPTPETRDEDVDMYMPVVIQTTATIIEGIHSSSSAVKRRKVLELLASANLEAHRVIVDGRYECKQVTRPQREGQYKKVVTDVINMVTNNRKPGIFKQNEKTKNIWQAILDERENRIIVSYRRASISR